MAIIGRALALDGEADPATVRSRVRALWGDRSSIDVGARKAYTTLVRLGVLTGGGRAPLRRGVALAEEGEVATWVVHALLLSRGSLSVDETELRTAPELFWLKVNRLHGGYPLLRLHNEGIRRRVWVASSSEAKAMKF